MKSVAVVSICTNFFLVGIIYWLSTYVSRIEGNYAQGAMALSMFFTGIMISRLGLSKLATAMNRAYLVAAGAVTGSGCFVIGLFMHDPTWAIVFFALCGLALGPIFPQTVSMACHIAPDNAGTASGIVFFGFIMGNLMSPLLIGALADIETIGLHMALILPAAVNIIGVLFAYRIRKIVA